MLTHRQRTILGDIPADWDAKPLKSLITEHFAGDWGSDEGEQAVAVLRSTNFTNDGQLDFSDIAQRFFTKDQADQFGLLKGDLLVERSGGGPEQPVGRIGFVERDMPGSTVSNFVQVLRPDPKKVDPEYLGWALFELQRSGLVERVQQQSTQMRNLNWRDYQRLMLPWPSVKEQFRISAALKLVDTAIQRAKAEVDAALELKKSLMASAFSSGLDQQITCWQETKLGRLPAGWRIKRVKDVLVGKPSNGYSPQSNPDPPGTKTLNVACVRNGECSIRKATYVDVDDSVVACLQVYRGDFFVLRGNGNRDFIGIGGVVREDIAEPMIYSDLLFRLRFKEEDAVPLFLPYMWQTQAFLHRLQAKAKSGSGLWKIGKRDIENELIALPDKGEQQEIVDAIERATRACNAAAERMNALAAVKRSLLQNLLTGAIRIPEGAIHA
ncbi:MAG: restriction endonuclease subunit S [Burkholderiales bacterium]|nr:restriction endonuclease subunit S [Burkholderiales bacterium]